MKAAGRCVVVTGGANGIGRALAGRFAAEGARGVVVADINAEWAQKVAERIGGLGAGRLGVGCDVADPDAIADLVRVTERSFGPVDIFCSNAGFSDPAPGDLSAPVDAWRRIVDVNMMAHVWAARAVLPSMLDRGEGYLLQTISSAALITGPSGPGYTMTKHGALGFAEWLTLNYGHRGIRVSCLCPNAVYTGMFGRPPGDESTAPPDVGALGEILMPEDVAGMVIEAMEAERFLILPHPRVGVSFGRKATDYDAWLARTRERLLRMRLRAVAAALVDGENRPGDVARGRSPGRPGW
jgi:NAD(P)-dependent dehydrogenase (short-subunit alcohol dehydrogenase family)